MNGYKNKISEPEIIEEYSTEVQALLISYMLAEPDSYIKCQNIIDVNYFDDRLKSAVRYIQAYTDKFHTLPQAIQIKAETGFVAEPISVSPQHNAWFLTTIESFARYKALELAVLAGADLVLQGRGGELEKRIKDAMSISLIQDLGTNYFEDPWTRIQNMLDKSDFHSTGWRTLDEKLNGGFTKGGLNIFAAGSGVGKSLWLQNISLNWAQAGKRVIYISLELSEDLVANRLDAMVSGFGTRQIFGNIREVAARILQRGKTTEGSLIIKRMPESSTTANNIRAFLKEYEIKMGHPCDALVVDYLDLMAPNNRAVNPSDLYVKDKYVSEEMRALLTEWNIIGATASQLNRQSVEASEYDHSHVSGGLSKVQTSDNFFGIMGTKSMKENGRIQIQFMKTRSSSAVGSFQDFKYDPMTMLISDKDEDVENTQAPLSTEDLRAKMDQTPFVKKPGLDVLSLMRKSRGEM